MSNDLLMFLFCQRLVCMAEGHISVRNLVSDDAVIRVQNLKVEVNLVNQPGLTDLSTFSLAIAEHVANLFAQRWRKPSSKSTAGV